MKATTMRSTLARLAIWIAGKLDRLLQVPKVDEI
jgi:hypothetical protein